MRPPVHCIGRMRTTPDVDISKSLLGATRDPPIMIAAQHPIYTRTFMPCFYKLASQQTHSHRCGTRIRYTASVPERNGCLSLLSDVSENKLLHLNLRTLKSAQTMVQAPDDTSFDWANSTQTLTSRICPTSPRHFVNDATSVWAKSSSE